MVKSKSEKVFDAANIVLMIVLTVVFVVPILLIVSASFTSARALTKYGYSLIIREFSWSSYSYIFLASDIFVRSLFNSVFMTVLATCGMVFTTSLYAYSLTRKQLKFKKLFSIFVVIPMLFAGGTIPYYLVVNDLHLMNTQWAIIIPFSVNAWNILLVRNFFSGIPESLPEAAQLEGANNMQVLFYVVIPGGFPIIATIILYSAVGVWNDWFHASLFLDSSHKNLWPVQAVVRQLQTDFESLVGSVGGGSSLGLNSEGIKSAAIVLSTLPIVLVYPFLQKFFINGSFAGAVKE